jgi:COP9 signalosome complex subunit 6
MNISDQYTRVKV